MIPLCPSRFISLQAAAKLFGDFTE